MPIEDENKNDLLYVWTKSDAIINCLILSLYFGLGIIAFTINLALGSPWSLIIIFLGLPIAIVLAYFRNRLVLKYHEEIKVKLLRRYLKILAFIFFFFVIFSLVYPYFGGTLNVEAFFGFIGALFFIAPLNVYLDFHTKIGEAVFYLNYALQNDLATFAISEGMKKLSNHLATYDISVTATDLTYAINIAKIKDEDISKKLKLMIESLKNKNKGLYAILKSILNDEKLIKKIEKTSWKALPQVLVSKPEMMKLSLEAIVGIVMIILFILTGKVLF